MTDEAHSPATPTPPATPTEPDTSSSHDHQEASPAMSRLSHLHPHAFTSHRDEARRYFLHHDMPYPVDCALIGHRPVWIDLTYGGGYMECSRCTLRPQMTDTARSWTGVGGDRNATPRQFLERALAEGEVYWRQRRAETHLETSRRYVDRFSVKVKIGNAVSETPLDAHLIIPGWRGFYFGTSVLGTRIAHWRSRRAKGNRYTSPVWSLNVDRTHISWSIGATGGGGKIDSGRTGLRQYRKATR